MSYPKELDEYSDEELKKEIQRRSKLNDEGKCTYCSKFGTEPICKQSLQHLKAREKAEQINENHRRWKFLFIKTKT